MADPVLSLDDAVAAEPAVSGGKAATLARLRSHGFPVPAGVVVTTDVYRTLVDDADIREPLARLRAAREDGDTDHQRAVAAQIREAIRSCSLPPSVRESLEATLPPGPYAVRSSATSEDLPEASFAGQYDTRLGVSSREELHEAIVGCMASLFTDRAVAYRARNDVDTDRMAMAVVVQRMVEPDASGILFSADPMTGERDVSVIDAGPGRGDTQVSGRTTADTLRVNRRSDTVEGYRTGSERTGHVLTDRDALALAAIGARIEDALGSPQDIEWAILDGEISVLQARPITALYPLPTPQPRDDRTHVYFSFGHRQGMTGAMPPLVLELWQEVTEAVRGDFGLPEPFAVTAGGRLYLDVTPYLTHPRLRRRMRQNLDYLDAPAAAALDTLLTARADEFPLRTPSLGGYWRAARSLTRVGSAVGSLFRPLPRAMLTTDRAAERDRVERVYETEIERAVDTIRSGTDPASRLAAARAELHRSLSWLLDPFYGVFLSAVTAGWLLRRLVPEADEHVDALALGVEDDVVYRMTSELGELADTARGTPAETALIEGATLEELSELEDTDAFLAAFDAFLEEYGFRAVGEIDFSRPRYRENPTPLLNVVAGLLEADEPDPQRVHERLDARARDAERALAREASPVLRPLVKRLVATYRSYVGIRELPKFVLSKLLDQLRTQVLGAAAELVAAGALSDPDDVWLLAFDELQRGLEDPRTLAGVDFVGRRRQQETLERLSPPRIITSDGHVPRGTAPETAVDGQLRGTGASPGVAEGPVRVVTDPTTQRLSTGEVLVAPYTDPGWTPLFLNAAAVVTEVGGRLTHGSLVAREYGIPAVVAVEDATTRLQTGDRVRVDGTEGTVDRLD